MIWQIYGHMFSGTTNISKTRSRKRPTCPNAPCDWNMFPAYCKCIVNVGKWFIHGVYGYVYYKTVFLYSSCLKGVLPQSPTNKFEAKHFDCGLSL